MRIEEEIQQKKFHNNFDRLYVNVLFTAGYLSTRNARVLKPFGITGQQYNVLRILRGQHPNSCSVSVIQDRMIDRSSNASRLVDKLLEKKLVERKTCKEDRRQVDIRITNEGLTVLEEIDPLLKQLDREMKTLTDEEAIQLSNLLDKLRG